MSITYNIHFKYCQPLAKNKSGINHIKSVTIIAWIGKQGYSFNLKVIVQQVLTKSFFKVNLKNN